MAELRDILDLWQRARAAGDEICLATVVGIEGSAYRRPGARMLLTASGRRAGTISGGCLEAEVAKKAWWLTAQGPSLQRYSSFFDDDGDLPYGLGCGGTVIVLLERGAAAEAALEALRCSVEERTASVIVSDTSAGATGSKATGTVLILREDGTTAYAASERPELLAEAQATLAARTSRSESGFFFEYVAPPPAVVVFGAGDDARPLVEFTATLGWHLTVADGRSQLLRAERFPQAARVIGLDAALAAIEPGDAAVLMTHSYEQDRQVLRALLPRELKYLGVLGPRRRTERLIGEIAPELGLTLDEGFARLRAPVGLDLGGHSPAAIALSIAAELQAVFAGREARTLTAVRLIHA